MKEISISYKTAKQETERLICEIEEATITHRAYTAECLRRVLKENEHKTEKIENQKAELAILNKKQKDLNKLQNTLSSYKGQFIKQEKENKKINSLIRKLKKDSKERQWIQTVDDEYLAYTEKAMYADELLSFLRGEE